MMPKDVISIVQKIVQPWVRSLQLMIGRCVLEAIDDSKGIQVAKLSLLQGETSEMERMQNYGFTSVPLPEAEGVAVFAGGNREHGICIVLDDRQFRLKNLGKGHVAVYDSLGNKVHLKNNGEIEVNAALKVKVTAPAVELGSGALQKILNGEAFQALFNAHTHTGNLGIPTSPPLSPSTPADLSATVKGSI